LEKKDIGKFEREGGLTIEKIAKLAGVSRSTVSRVITGHPNVKAATRQRVEKVIQEVNYSPNSIARGLARGTLNIVALLVGDIRNPFYSEIARSVEDIASREGYMVVLCDTDYDFKKEKLYLNAAKQYGFAGLILMTAMDSEELIPVLDGMQCPVVLLNRYIHSYESDVVLVDNYQGGYMVAQHLTELGHRHIGFLAGPELSTASSERGKGFRQGLEDAGIKLKSSDIAYGNLQMPSGYEYGKKISRMKRRPTAIFAGNDLMALGIIQALSEEGIRVPEDISIVGYDDLPVTSVSPIALTTVRQPQSQMGEVAMSMLIERIQGSQAGSRRVVYQPQLIIRKTTANRNKEIEHVE
jgi:LacI family transcriptional regulator